MFLRGKMESNELGQWTEGNSFYGLAIMELFSWGDIWIYLLANFAGGAAAAFVFLFIQVLSQV